MGRFSRYTVYIFFGFLISLIMLFAISTMFSPTNQTKSADANNTATNSATTLSQDNGQAVAGPDLFVQLAKAEVTKLTGYSVDKITLKSQEQIDWPTTALGCGQAGFLYNQVITPGYRILLTTPEEEFEFHTDMDKEVLLCQSKVLEQ